MIKELLFTAIGNAVPYIMEESKKDVKQGSVMPPYNLVIPTYNHILTKKQYDFINTLFNGWRGSEQELVLILNTRMGLNYTLHQYRNICYGPIKRKTLPKGVLYFNNSTYNLI